MRKIIYNSLKVKLIFLFLTELAFAELSPHQVLSARGFREGKCFSHPAIRRCQFESKKFSCILEIFPNTAGKLRFDLDPKDALIFDKASTDYGIFLFQLISAKSDQAPKIKIISIKRLPLSTWDRTMDKTFQAKMKACTE